MTAGYALFDTAIGCCGIVWSERGVLGVQLPERDRHRTEQRIRRRFPDAGEAAPSPEAQQAIDGIVGLIDDGDADLSTVPLDVETLPAFDRLVYDIALTIGPGETVTYGDIARRIGDVSLSRDVGQALGRNPYPLIVPCHRVLAAGGRLGGFSAHGGIATKQRLLEIEGAFKDAPTLFRDLPVAQKPRSR